MSMLNKEVVTHVTKECMSDQCRMHANFGGSMLASNNYYDKDGILHVNDPNYIHGTLSCMTCNRQWEIHAKGKEVTSCKIF